MSCEENKKIVRKLLELMTKWDLPGVFNMMADDGSWWVAGKADEFPVSGWKTKKEMQTLLEQLGPLLKSPAVITIHGMVAEGDMVAVTGESHGVSNKGRNYNNEYHFLFEVRDGKVQTVKEYCDTAHAKRVFLEP
jgi:hypothetical protein